MPGRCGWARAGTRGGRQARTVRSGSERARLSAAPVPSSSHSRSRAALRTRAMPLRSARPTSWRRCEAPARRRHQAGRAAARHGGGAASLRRVPAGRRAAQDRSAAPGRPPTAQRRLHPALVACRHLVGDLHRPRRAVGGVELHPLPGYPGEREHGNDLIAEQRLGQLVEVRTGQHAAALDRGDQLGGDPVRGGTCTAAARPASRGGCRGRGSRGAELTASSWRVLEPHPHGERSSSRHSPSESPASASSSIARSPPASVRIAPTYASHDSLDRESAAARLPRDGQDSSPPMRSAGTSLQYLQVNASSGQCPWLSVRWAVRMHACTDI